MTDWKQKIEAQIAQLQGLQPLTASSIILTCEKAAITMQALLDLAVAWDEYDGTSEDALIKALDKLREVGDD